MTIDNLDKEKFSKDLEVVKADKVYLMEISDKLTQEFTLHLDSLMQKIYKLIKDDEMDDDTLEKNFLELTNLIYFMGDKLESLGIELTVASSRNQEIFNRLHREASGTIADKKAAAEDGSRYESLVKVVYESVYKRIKLKIEAANEMVSSLKRILMKRVSAMEMTRRTGNYGARAACEGD